MNGPRPPHDPQRREQAEPEERFRSIPIAYLIYVAIATLIGFVYIVRFGGDEGMYGDMRTPSALTVATNAGGKANGEQLFGSLCVSCHQPTGLGLPGVFPPLAGSEWVNAKPEIPVKILLKGLSGAVSVKNQTYNGQMPSFKQLTDEEIAAVLTTIRGKWGNTATAVTPEVVHKLRGELPAPDQPWKGEAELGRP